MFEEDAVVGPLLLLEGAEELVEVVERRLDALLLGRGEGRSQLPFLYSDRALMYLFDKVQARAKKLSPCL